VVARDLDRAKRMMSLQGTSVLIVDDDLETLSMYVQTLERLEAKVKGVTDAAGALTILEIWHPDVILCDLHLPGVDGYTLLARLRERSELDDVPVIAISGSHPALEAERCKRVGFRDHLVKPVRLNTIVAAIEAATQSTDIVA
jgi:two-component system cell cycle response regulator DivK